MGAQLFIVFSSDRPSEFAAPFLGRVVTDRENPFENCFPPSSRDENDHLPTLPTNTTWCVEKFDENIYVTGEECKSMNISMRTAKVLGGGVEASKDETYTLKGSSLRTVTLADHGPMLEYYQRYAPQLEELSQKHPKGHLYLMTDLRFAEAPTIKRTAGNDASAHAELSVPVGAALGVPTTSGVGDVAAAAQTSHSRSRISTRTAEGEIAFAAAYIRLEVSKGILRKSMVVKSKGKAIPHKGDIILMAASADNDIEDEGDTRRTLYAKPSLAPKED